MDINERIAALYEKDTKVGYANLLALEEQAKEEDVLGPYLPEFIAMLESGQYVVRVRGFRLLCLQARWDEAGVIDGAIDEILAAVDDEKPTAVRQALLYLTYMAPYKKQLHDKMRTAVQAIDLSQYKDTMAPLIMKDIKALLPLLEDA